MRRNMLVLAAGWRQGGRVRRYFLGTHILANLLTVGFSTASLGASLYGQGPLQMGLLGVAGLCALQALYSWRVLQQRYGLGA